VAAKCEQLQQVFPSSAGPRIQDQTFQFLAANPGPQLLPPTKAFCRKSRSAGDGTQIRGKRLVRASPEHARHRASPSSASAPWRHGSSPHPRSRVRDAVLAALSRTTEHSW
jgi:hypothetical protein